MSDLKTVMTLAGRYDARLSTTEQDGPIPDCELCPEHPVHPGRVAISSTDLASTDVCWDHVQLALEIAAQAADDARDRHPDLQIEITTPAPAVEAAA